MLDRIKLGILSALQEEQTGLQAYMENKTAQLVGSRIYTSGTLWGVECVSVLSGIGKAAAASTTAILADKFKVTHILMTGVAGSASEGIGIGDIVIAESSVQHDMDARPLFPRFEIPAAGITRFESDKGMTQELIKSCRQFIDIDFATVVDNEDKKAFAITSPKVHRGLIGSGDQFINCKKKLSSIQEVLPDLLAVEMEGAAAAQVCHDFGMPFAMVRTVSDHANEASAIDFNRFIQRVASIYAVHIIRRLCQNALAQQ